MPEPGGPLAPTIFGRSVNPIPTKEGRLPPPITTGTPNVFHLQASLDKITQPMSQLTLSGEGKGHFYPFFLARSDFVS